MTMDEGRERCGEHLHARQVISGNQRTSSSIHACCSMAIATGTITSKAHTPPRVGQRAPSGAHGRLTCNQGAIRVQSVHPIVRPARPLGCAWAAHRHAQHRLRRRGELALGLV